MASRLANIYRLVDSRLPHLLLKFMFDSHNSNSISVTTRSGSPHIIICMSLVYMYMYMRMTTSVLLSTFVVLLTGS